MAKQKEGNTATAEAPKSRLQAHYKDNVLPAMVKEMEYSTPMQAPKLVKIVINMGVGEATKDGKLLDNSVRDLTVIAGQAPVITTAKKAISNFRLRQGVKIGAKVTLRGDRMYHFLDKLITVVFPRLRDFQGLNPKSFDGRGNFAVGLKEQLVFPEISYDTFDRIRGMDIVICTTAKTDDEARTFLKKMGMPIRDK
ncbi:MAG TPA: 50S ribosomal protein L5 [Fimbriimonadales bacterium]|jgi:large subunit ribosomal protein L5|nr:50S ribosomal protein L5 [Fimbriimonadales bacterium]